MASRASGIVPIDTPCVKVNDYDGLRERIHQSKELGFVGLFVLTPHQIDIAREIYTPSDENIETAKKIVKGAEGAEREQKTLDCYKNIKVLEAENEGFD